MPLLVIDSNDAARMGEPKRTQGQLEWFTILHIYFTKMIYNTSHSNQTWVQTGLPAWVYPSGSWGQIFISEVMLHFRQHKMMVACRGLGPGWCCQSSQLESPWEFHMSEPGAHMPKGFIGQGNLDSSDNHREQTEELRTETGLLMEINGKWSLRHG